MTTAEYKAAQDVVAGGGVVTIGGRTAHDQDSLDFAVKAAGGVKDADSPDAGVVLTTQELTDAEKADLAAGNAKGSTPKVKSIDQNAPTPGTVATDGSDKAAADKAAADKAAADKAAADKAAADKAAAEGQGG